MQQDDDAWMHVFEILKFWDVTEKLLLHYIIPFSWGLPTNVWFHVINKVFWRRCRGIRGVSERGVSHSQSHYFFFVLLSCFILFTFNYQKHTKISLKFLVYFQFVFFLVIMSSPVPYVMWPEEEIFTFKQ